MPLLITIAEYSLLLFGVLLFAVQLAAHEAGYRVGRRVRAKSSSYPESVGVVVGGMLGLLAFVLALTLSFANSRYSDLRASTLAEANAIGTAWLRAEAIGGPHGGAIKAILEDYAKVRQDFVEADLDESVLGSINQRTNALQNAIWAEVTGLVRERADPVASSLMAAVNDTFDASTSARFSFAFRLPPQIFWLLLAMTLLGMGSLGYQLGLRERPLRVLVPLLSLMWTIVIVDILDLASARFGSFRTSTAVYEWTRQGFGPSVPPAPDPSRP